MFLLSPLEVGQFQLFTPLSGMNKRQNESLQQGNTELYIAQTAFSSVCQQVNVAIISTVDIPPGSNPWKQKPSLFNVYIPLLVLASPIFTHPFKHTMYP